MNISQALINKAEQKLMFGTDTNFTKAEVKDIRFACEKQIAISAAPYDNDSFTCPKCGEIVPDYQSENTTECFCNGCGQKLTLHEQ